MQITLQSAQIGISGNMYQGRQFRFCRGAVVMNSFLGLLNAVGC